RATMPVDLREFDVTSERGFLPVEDPLTCLPQAYSPWEQIGAELPKLLAADRARATLEAMPVFDVAGLTDARQRERAMVLLSYFGHAYVWGSHTPAERLPAPV